MEYKLVTAMILSFALVLFLFLGILVGFYYFTLNASGQFNTFLKDMPLDKMLSIGGISSIMLFISRKYQKNK